MTTPRFFSPASHVIHSLIFFALAARAVAADGGSAIDPENLPEATRLPEVIVTAEKEPAPAQCVPLSVTAVTAETIKEADIREIKQAEVYAPNVFINEFTARKLSNPYVRGIGSSPANPGVTTYIDGVPHLNAYSSNI